MGFVSRPCTTNCSHWSGLQIFQVSISFRTMIEDRKRCTTYLRTKNFLLRCIPKMFELRNFSDTVDIVTKRPLTKLSTKFGKNVSKKHAYTIFLSKKPRFSQNTGPSWTFRALEAALTWEVPGILIFLMLLEHSLYWTNGWNRTTEWK